MLFAYLVRADACLTVTDAGRKLAFEREAGRRSAAKLQTRDEAFLLAANFAKLPMMPRQILKDIPRPPNTASGDDRMPVNVRPPCYRPGPRQGKSTTVCKTPCLRIARVRLQRALVRHPKH